MRTRIRSFTCSLDGGVLADAVLVPLCKLILPTNIKKVKGCLKSTETSNTKPFIIKFKKKM